MAFSEPTDLTIEILKDIRDEVRQTRTDLTARIDATNGRIDSTNARLDVLREDLSERIDGLSRRVAESEIRTAWSAASRTLRSS